MTSAASTVNAPWTVAPPVSLGAMGRLASAELDVRLSALRAGFWLGWLSVAAVLVALALGLPARHGTTLLVLTLAAAVANAAVVAVPQSWWTTARRGEQMLNLWSAGLVALMAALVLVGGGTADLDLLSFLILPFLATVHTGRRRAAWLTVALAAFAAVMVMAPDPLPAGQISLRACLLIATTVLALTLGELTRRAAAARAELSARAELEHLLLAEAHHRVKNSLQTVADLLLLGRPDGVEARAFDETADRIRSIAVVHRLLAEERGAHVDARALLELIADGLAPDARVATAEVLLEPTCAQHLGVIANELIANAVEHGRGPIDVQLRREGGLVLVVRDHGRRLEEPCPRGLGLRLVERVVEQGLHGTFAIEHDEHGATQASVMFDPDGS